MLSPKFEVISVISQKSLCAPKIWGISQNFGLSPIQFIPKKLGLSPKIRLLSQNLGYIPKFSLYPKKIRLSPKMGYLPILGYIPKLVVCLGVDMAVPKRGLVVQSCGLWHSFKSLARNRKAAASSSELLGENQWNHGFYH